MVLKGSKNLIQFMSSANITVLVVIVIVLVISNTNQY